MGKLKTIGYSLKDVAVIQAPVSFVNHRADANPFINICNRCSYPIFVAPMATVTDEKNYQTWIDNQVTPVVPRSVMQRLSFDERMKIAKKSFVSISLKEAQNDFVQYTHFATNFNPTVESLYICIDIAHGTLSELYDICKFIKNEFADGVEIMTGNIANPAAYSFYADAGISWVRAGVGGGSRCVCAGTKITMADGSKQNIEDINRGDYVLTKDGAKKVLNTFEKKCNSTLIINDNIECTDDHKFFVIKKSLLTDSSDINDDFIKKHGEYIEAKDLTDEYLLVGE